MASVSRLEEFRKVRVLFTSIFNPMYREQLILAYRLCRSKIVDQVVQD